MSIRGRLVASFASLLVLLFVVAAVSLNHFKTLSDKTQTLVDQQARRVFLAQRLNSQAQDAAIFLLNLLQTARRDDRVPLYLAMDESIAESNQTVKELTQTLSTPELQDVMVRLIFLRKRYSVLLQETVELLEIEGAQSARPYFEDRTQKVLRTIIFETQGMTRELQQTMQLELEQLHQSSNTARRIILSLTGFIALASLFLAFMLARSVIKPVKDAIALAQAIAQGNYHDKVLHTSKNEMGVLLGSLEAMRNSIASREDKIMRLAYVDQLTGLPNRTRLLETMRTQAHHNGGVLAVLDIDRFTPINNALGLTVGDRILCEVGQRLQQVQPNSMVARLWGDEFGILFDGADKSQAQTDAQALLTHLQRPLLLNAQRLDLSIRMGLVVYEKGEVDPGALLRCADMAMGEAKRRHDKMVFCDSLTTEPAPAQLSLLGEMQEALAHGEFVVYYQPKLDLSRQQITAAEALLRWQHPQRGLIAPMQFIPFAEHTGFIREITPWILRVVIQQAAKWVVTGPSIVTSVNLSTHDLLNPSLVSEIKCLLTEFNLPPAKLCLEITESALMDDPVLALRQLTELAEHGVTLSIDDYGTGQASLAYVKTLPVGELKIDRTFITAVNTATRSAAIVRSTLLMCHELNLKVVAEGAETAQELAWLTNAGCDFVQGFVVAKPMPMDNFVEWVSEFNTTHQTQVHHESEAYC